MIELTRRQRQCLQFLCRREAFATTDEIARHLSVSARTVRTELNVVDAFAREHGCALERVPGSGVRIAPDQGDRAALLAAIETAEGHAYSVDERAVVAQMMLIVNPVVRFQDIADYCRVSRQTVVAHFGDVVDFFARSGVEVQSDSGVGSRVSGNEMAIRRCFMSLISSAQYGQLAQSVAFDCLGEVHIAAADRIIARVEKLKGVSFADPAQLCAIVAFILDRIARNATGGGANDESATGALRVLRGTDDASMRALADALVADVPFEFERLFLTSVFLAQRTTRVAEDTLAREDDQEDVAFRISRDLINALSELHVRCDEPLQHLIDGLTTHLRAAIWRSRNGIQIKSRVPIQVMSSIPLLFDFARRQMGLMEERYGISLNESEVAYIAMYLDTIYETSMRSIVRLKVLFVCSFGLASSSILMMRLAHALGECEVAGPVTIDEARSYLADHDVDLVISTNDVSLGTTAVLTVDPLLSNAELDKVKNRLMQSSYSKMCAQFLHAYTSTAEPQGARHTVREYVDPQNIQVGVACDDWREAIRIASAPLLKQELIEQRYVDRMIGAVEDFGPYMVLTPGTAYVHAGVNDGTFANCVAICVLAREIPLGPANEKRIRTIIVLGMHDKNRSDLLNLAPIFERPETIAALEDGGLNVDDVLELHT